MKDHYLYVQPNTSFFSLMKIVTLVSVILLSFPYPRTFIKPSEVCIHMYAYFSSRIEKLFYLNSKFFQSKYNIF